MPRSLLLSCGTCKQSHFVADDTINPQPKKSLLHLPRAEVCLQTPNHAAVMLNESTSRPQKQPIPSIHRLLHSELAANRFSHPKTNRFSVW